jgi:hypothetical protein
MTVSRWICRRCGGARTRGPEFDATSGSSVAGGGSRVRGRRSPRLARGVRRRPGGRRADSRRRDLHARRGCRGGPAVARRRFPGRGAGAGQNVRRRRPVRGGRRGNGARPLRVPAPAAASVRNRRDHHRGTEPGCHRGAADASGADHGPAAAGTGASVRLRDRTPGQRRVAAASGVEPDQPARIPHRERVVHRVHAGDGAAMAGRGGHRLRRVPGVLPGGSQRAARSPGDRSRTADAGVRVGGGGADAGRIRDRRSGGGGAGLGGARRGGGDGGAKPGPTPHHGGGDRALGGTCRF